MSLKGVNRDIYYGDLRNTPYFWGDVCKERIKYVRNFVYPDINTLKMCPMMPYYDPQRPYVNFWFASTEAPDVASLNACLSDENQHRLENEGGACIIYTHFGKGFVRDGELNSEFKELIARLSERDGWFIPVSELLDYLLEKRKGNNTISRSERNILERMWIKHKLRIGTS